MKQKLRNRILALLLCLCLVSVLLPTGAMAADMSYVVLGDSISTGYGLNGAPNFAAIVAAGTYDIENLANDGDTSSDLLAKLQDPSGAVLAAVKGADLITITIGGNDLMNALYEFIAEKYNEGKDESQQIGAEQVREAFVDEQSPIRTAVMMTAIQNISSFANSPQAGTALYNFSQNLGKIIGIIKANSNATVIVANQYNPYSRIDQLSSVFDSGVKTLNDVIAAGAASGAYLVADVYDAFESASENPCNAYYNPPFDFDLDFHPNAFGHELIADTIIGMLKVDAPISELLVNNVDILNGGKVDGVSYDVQSNTLTLNNATIDTVCAESMYADGIYVSGDLNIVLKGENVIKGEGIDYGIDADPGSLTITGDGSLMVEGADVGIYAAGSVTIGGTVDITATGEDAIYSASSNITIGSEHFKDTTSHVVIKDGILQEANTPITELLVNNVDILNGGEVDGVSYDAQSNTLTLDGAVINTANDAGIFADGDLNIVLKGENKISGEEMDNGIILVFGSLSITGDGSLTVEGKEYGIGAGGDITIGGTVDIVATGENAIYSNSGNITIGGERFSDIVSRVVIKDGVLQEAYMPITELLVNNVDILNGGEVEGVSYDAQSNTLTLNNATIDTVCEESKYADGIYVDGNLNIVLKGENVIKGEGIDYGIDADPGSLTITGDGSLTVEGTNTGIYVAGSVTIGGTVDITATGGEDAIYSDSGNITISGEQFIAVASHVVIKNGILQEANTPITELWVNNIDILNGGEVDGVSYDAQSNTLTLNNATIDTVCEESGYADGISADGNLNIVLKGENVIKGEGIDYGIGVEPGSLTITGDGSLTVEGTNTGIYAAGSVTIGGTVDITATGEDGGVYSSNGQVFFVPSEGDEFYVWTGDHEGNAALEPGSPFTEKTKLFVYNVDMQFFYPSYIHCYGVSGHCEISVSPTELDFGTVEPGYSTTETKEVTVTNTGKTIIQLIQPASENYEIGLLSKTVLAPNETATFTVQPKAGLGGGNYDGEIVIYADIATIIARSLLNDGISVQEYDTLATVDVSFRVGENNNYTLTFETNGGSKIDSVTKAEGSVVNLASYEPRKEGYTFSGWYADEELTEKITSVTLDSNKTIYAGWTKVTGSSDPTKPGNTDSPQTGDNSNMMLWFALLFVSGSALGTIYFRNLRKKQR